MAEPHVISALVAKYRQLSGQLNANEKESERLRSALSHLDATIRLFRDGYDTTGIVPKRPYRRNPLFKKGMLIRTALDILRTANEPLTARELAKRTLQYLGIGEPDDAAIEQVRRGLNGCLMQRLKDGSVMADSSYPKKWSLTLKKLL